MPAWSLLRSLTEVPLLDDCPHAGPVAGRCFARPLAVPLTANH